MNINNNRCIGFTKNNKKCRAIISNNDNKFFCCDSHQPLNKEILKDGCFICMEKIEKSNELIYFKCKHIFHKPCYLDWLIYSTYKNSICLVCRNEVLINKNNIKTKYNQLNAKLLEKLINIDKELNIYNPPF